MFEVVRLIVPPHGNCHPTATGHPTARQKFEHCKQNRNSKHITKISQNYKLYENKLIFVDTEELEYPKTQLLEAIIAPFRQDKICFLTGSESANNNF